MKVLVTGGAGFIGSHTVVELVKAGYQPVIVDNFSNSKRSVIAALEKLLGQKVPCYEQDYTDAAALSKLLKRQRVGAIIHFAAYKEVAESVEQPLKYYANNVSGLISLLQVVNQLGIKHFVFSSSCTVYGQPKKLPVTEATPLQPAASPYGETKQMGEAVIRDVTAASRLLNAISLRYFNPIGAHPSALIGELPQGVPANLVPLITQATAGQRKKLLVYGDDYPTPDGTCIRDYIHVVDLAAAHVKALDYIRQQPAGAYDTMNVGTGKGSSVLQVIKTFEKVTGQKLAYTIGLRRAGDIASTYASVAKARRLLNWRAEKTLADALTDAWRWQQTL